MTVSIFRIAVFTCEFLRTFNSQLVLKNKYIIFGLCVLVSAVIAFFIVPSQNKKQAEGVDVVRVVRTVETNTLITDNLENTGSIHIVFAERGEVAQKLLVEE